MQDQAMKQPVARVVYASQANIAGSVYAEMERIRACAVRNNEPLGIHTALLYQSGWFVQWKEGPGDALLRLMDRVCADARHHSMRIVHSSRGPRLLAGPWSMAIVQCADDPRSMTRRVLALRRRMEGGLQYAPPAVWRQISTPLQNDGAALQADPDAFQRVLVCSAAGSASFDFVHWVARRTGKHVVHRRFAGARDLDVGTDLVDFGHGGGMMRLIAMARRGLALPLTRAFLPDYSHLLLLLAEDAPRNTALLCRVREACDGLAVPPVLVGVGQSGDQHAELLALARHLGLVYLACQADPHHFAGVWSAAQPLFQVKRETASPALPIQPLPRLVTA